MTASSGPGHRAQDRGDGPRGDGRAAARRHRRPARRPVDRHAHQERAGRPAPGHVRAQLATRRSRSSRRRRPASASTIAIEAWRHRAQVHDPGRLPVRRVPRHRLRAVADPGRRRPARHRASPTRPRRRPRSSPTCATPRRSPGRGRCPARPASSTASAASRRPTSPATSATTRTTTTGCSCCARPRSPASPTDIPPLEVFGPATRRPADPRLGLDLRRDPLRGRAPAGRGQVRRPRPPAPPQPVPGQHRGRPAQLPAGAHPGGQPRPAADADPGAATSSTPSATTRSAASRSASPRSSTRPNASSRSDPRMTETDRPPTADAVAVPAQPPLSAGERRRHRS